MRVYILASQDKYSFAEKLLEDIRNAKIISRPLMNEVIVEISSDIKKEVANADIILAIIDKNFTDNVMLNTEFQLVLMESRKNKNKLLLPIVLDDADIPVALESMLYVKCNSLSKEDIEKTKLKIKSVLEHRRYTVKTRNLKENQSRTSSMIILTLAIEMLAILFIVMFFKEGPIGAGYFDDENIITISIGLIAVMLSITTLFTSYFSIMKRRWQEDDEEEIESYSRRLKRAIVPDARVCTPRS